MSYWRAMIRCAVRISPLAAVMAALMSGPLAQPARAESEAVTLYVRPGGSDGNACTAPALPCASIQSAVNKAGSGATILIAGGTYTFAFDACGNGVNAVVCVVSKNLSLRGGYDPATWSGPNPAQFTTVIDGQNARRGIAVLGNANAPPRVAVSSLTIRNGVASQIAAEPNIFGGGMYVNTAAVDITDVRLLANAATGPSNGGDAGGGGAGGGLALLSPPGVNSGVSTLTGMVFDGNRATGGAGATRGGYGIGGGLFAYYVVVNASRLTVTNNIAQGGTSSGGGIDGGERGDGLGGGLAFMQGSTGSVDGSTISGNRAIGGGAGANGGQAFGGGVFAEDAIANITASELRGNTAQGATSPAGGMAGGGAIELQNSSGVLRRNRIIGNEALGGNGAQSAGAAGGGGIYAQRLNGNATVMIENNIIASNAARQGSGPTQGGGGGGVWIQGLPAAMSHNTLAQNNVGSNMIGAAIIVLSFGTPTASSVSLDHSIVADHTTGSAAIWVEPGNSLILNRGLWSGNSANTGGSGAISGAGSMLGADPGFASPGSPNFNYRLTPASPAIDAATGSAMRVDVDNTTRPQGRAPDIGAHEFFDSSNLKPRLHIPLVIR